MFERQIAKHAVVVRRVGLIKTLGKNLPRRTARRGVGGKGLSGASEYVPGDLIEKNAQCQCPVWSIGPVIEPPICGLDVPAAKKAPYLFIERLRRLKPVAAVRWIKPEVQYLIRHYQFPHSSPALDPLFRCKRQTRPSLDR